MTLATTRLLLQAMRELITKIDALASHAARQPRTTLGDLEPCMKAAEVADLIGTSHQAVGKMSERPRGAIKANPSPFDRRTRLYSKRGAEAVRDELTRSRWKNARGDPLIGTQRNRAQNADEDLAENCGTAESLATAPPVHLAYRTAKRWTNENVIVASPRSPRCDVAYPRPDNRRQEQPVRVRLHISRAPASHHRRAAAKLDQRALEANVGVVA